MGKLQEHVLATAMSKDKLKNWIEDEIIVKGLGITDPSDEELDVLAADPAGALTVLSAIISLRAHVGWSTHGHTAVDVNIYSSDPKGLSNGSRRNVENTDVGVFLRTYLDVDVEEITEELKEKMVMPDFNMLKLDAPVDEYHRREIL